LKLRLENSNKKFYDDHRPGENDHNGNGVNGDGGDSMERSLDRLSLHPNEIQITEDFFVSLFSHSSIIIVYQDVHLKYTWVWNPAFGLSVEDMLGRTDADFLPPNEAEDMIRIKRQVVESGLPHRAGTTILTMVNQMTQEPETRFYDAEIHPIFGSDGGVVGIRTSMLDITKHKELELELQRTRIEAEDIAKAKGDFLATMSHEIRTPMNGVIGAAELLADTSLSPDQSDLLETIRKSGRLLLSIINDILTFSKIESGKEEFQTHPYSLLHVVEDVIDMFSNQAAGKGIKLTFDISKNVPSTVIGDGVHYQQILINLVGNAIKFTENGEICIKIDKKLDHESGVLRSASNPAHATPAIYRSPSASSNSGTLELQTSVRDTGIGIPPEKKTFLFKPFSQATTRKYGGTGLGLVICEKLVHSMSGAIWFDSSVGKEDHGSVFTFCVKVEEAEKDQAKTEAPFELNRSLSEKYPLRILLAEDNVTNQKLFLRMLTKMGYSADVAFTGDEVLTSLESKPAYDLIFMDVQMPKMDGIEATQIIRQKYGSHPTIVAMTANTMPEDKRRCTDAGMDDFLGKPVQQASLQESLQIWGRKLVRSKPKQTAKNGLT